jgi:hypothetical protein
MLRRIEREGADGLSLNGPFTFLAFTDGKQSYLGQLHDGPVTQEQLTTMMHAIVSDRSTDFAKGNKKGRDLQIEAWIMR